MQKIFLSALLLSGITSYAQTAFYLPEPEGWNTEIFDIPIEFAPEIKYNGKEYLRFTPGWGDNSSEEHWSYCFIWWLKGDIKFKAEVLERDLEAYYQGLVGRNITRRKIDSSLVVPTHVVFTQSPKESGDYRTFFGTVRMLNYMNQKPVTLNVKAHVMACKRDLETMIFFEVSPQPLTHHVWQQLRTVHDGFRCIATSGRH